MSEILYKRSEAVAKLNQVDGFSPLELARVIQKEGQEDQRYLDVKFRKLWFRLCNPNGKITKKVLAFRDNMAIVEARVYLDKDAPEDSYIASALSQRFRTDDPQFGDKFLEMAETAATGRALSDAGFGIQFAEGEESDPNQVDAGIAVSGIPVSTDIQQPYEHVAQEENNLPVPNQQMYGQSYGNQFFDPTQMMEASEAMRQNNGGQYGAQAYIQMPSAPQPINTLQKPQIDRTRPVEELVKQITYQEAKEVVIGGNGANANKTMGQLAIENPSSLEWYLRSYKGPDNLIRAAAQVLLQQAAA